jgi:hypothetical protein
MNKEDPGGVVERSNIFVDRSVFLLFFEPRENATDVMAAALLPAVDHLSNNKAGPPETWATNFASPLSRRLSFTKLM